MDKSNKLLAFCIKVNELFEYHCAQMDSNLIILGKIKDQNAREYYLEFTKKCGWTRSFLVVQIESQAYERHMLQNKQHSLVCILVKLTT